MPLVKVLLDGEVQEMGIFNIVGKIRGDYASREIVRLPYKVQGEILHSLLREIADGRETGSGTKIKNVLPSGKDARTWPLANYANQKWKHTQDTVEYDVLHASSGDKKQNSRTSSATVFFYKENDGNHDMVVIAAGTHLNGIVDYDIVWGVNAGYRATV